MTAQEKATAWLSKWDATLQRGDTAGAAQLFLQDCYWRDLLSFTWNLKTAEGQDQIREMLDSTLPSVKPANWTIDGEATEADGITEAWFKFETAIARGNGLLRLKDGKAWTLLTTMVELKGHEEARGETRPKGVEHGPHKGRKTWLENREEEARTLGYSKQPHVVIIGGGQAGIILGARLRKLGVPAIIIEKNARAGDSCGHHHDPA